MRSGTDGGATRAASQAVLLHAMQDDRYKTEKEERRQVLMNRALRVKDVLSDPKYADYFTSYPFNSGYFMCLKLKTVEAEALRVHLLEKYGVGLIALGKQDLRVAFSCIEKEDAQELFDTVLKGVSDLE